MQPGPGKTLEELALLTKDLAKRYATLSERTLLRDLEVLERMELVTKTEGRYQINLALLVPQMPRRRNPGAAVV
jgi:hypothetical protein